MSSRSALACAVIDELPINLTCRSPSELHRHGKGEVLFVAPGHCIGPYDLRPFIDKLPALSADDKEKIFNTNPRKVYSRLDL